MSIEPATLTDLKAINAARGGVFFDKDKNKDSRPLRYVRRAYGRMMDIQQSTGQDVKYKWVKGWVFVTVAQPPYTDKATIKVWHMQAGGDAGTRGVINLMFAYTLGDPLSEEGRAMLSTWGNREEGERISALLEKMRHYEFVAGEIVKRFAHNNPISRNISRD